ncbi:MAG: prepilin-type N-terminal cleavage/methylation domain-containing protein [Caulobacteraceae bacterium]
MPFSSRRSNDGFTLVELLASLVVLAMLSLMLTAGLSERGIAWARMDRDTSSGEVVEAAQAVLADRLGHVWPTTIYDFLQPRPDFDGTTDWVQFLAPPPAARGLGPLKRYRLSLNVGGDLSLDSVSDVALDRRQPTDSQLLMRGVQALDIDYFGRVAPNQPAAWRPDWKRQAALPSLVRIRVGFPAGDRRRWPDLIVHPAADVGSDCTLNTGIGCAVR